MDISRRAFTHAGVMGLAGVVASSYVPTVSAQQATQNNLPSQFLDWIDAYQKAHPEIRQPDSNTIKYEEPGKLRVEVHYRPSGENFIEVVVQEDKVRYTAKITGAHIQYFSISEYYQGGHFSNPSFSIDVILDHYYFDANNRIVSHNKNRLVTVDRIFKSYEGDGPQDLDTISPEQRAKIQERFNGQFSRFFEILTDKIKN